MVYTKELAIKEINRLKKIFTKPSVEAKKDKDLVNWINKEIEKNYPNLNESLSAKMWLVLHEGYKLICPYGNKRKFCRRSRNEPQFNCVTSCQCTIENRNKTIIEKYGVLGLLSIPENQNKLVKTCLEKYGSKSANGNKDIMKKQINTRKNKCMIKYGVSHEKQIHFSEYAKEILNNKEKFSEMILKLGSREMAKQLNVSQSTIVVYHKN